MNEKIARRGSIRDAWIASGVVFFAFLLAIAVFYFSLRTESNRQGALSLGAPFPSLVSVGIALAIGVIVSIGVFFLMCVRRHTAPIIESFDPLGVVFYAYNDNNRYLHLQGDIQSLLGFESSSMSFAWEKWWERVHPEDLPALREQMEKATVAESAFQLEYRVRNKEDKHIWLLCKERAIAREDGIFVTGMLMNVDRQRRMEQTISDRKAAAGACLWKAEPEGQRVQIAESREAVPKYSTRELIEKRYSEFIASEALTEFKTHAVRALQMPFQKVAEGGFSSGDMPHGIPALSFDRTFSPSVRGREAIPPSAPKGEFLAVMSREFRTPLNSVLGYSDLLVLTELNEEQRNYVEIIRNGGTALLRMVEDTLDFTRVNSGKILVKSRTFTIRRICDDVIEQFSSVAKAKNLEMEMVCADNVPPYLTSDAAILKQILTRLLENAVKFTEKGKVAVHVERNERADDPGKVPLIIKVSDTGTGIPESLQPYLFEPFTQMDSLRSAGAGIGLAICKKLTDFLGGQIYLESSTMMGSIFTLKLSMEEGTEDQLRDKERPPQWMGSSANPRVLVVEDNLINRQLLLRMLRTLNIEADEAEDGCRAVEMHRLQAYDLIFMDIHMPSMDGLTACRLIRESETDSSSKTPVLIVAVTAEAMPEDRERCLHAGMNDYLSKPVTRADLIRVFSLYKRQAPDSTKLANTEN